MNWCIEDSSMEPAAIDLAQWPLPRGFEVFSLEVSFASGCSLV